MQEENTITEVVTMCDLGENETIQRCYTVKYHHGYKYITIHWDTRLGDIMKLKKFIKCSLIFKI